MAWEENLAWLTTSLSAAHEHTAMEALFWLDRLLPKGVLLRDSASALSMPKTCEFWNPVRLED